MNNIISQITKKTVNFMSRTRDNTLSSGTKSAKVVGIVIIAYLLGSKLLRTWKMFDDVLYYQSVYYRLEISKYYGHLLP